MGDRSCSGASRVGAAILLSRLAGVRQMGRDRWIAKCPAHDDRRASMSIRELDDGRVLVKCFALCETAEILAAVGLEFGALFPERSPVHARPERRPFPAGDVLRAMAHEATIVAVCARTLANGTALSAGDLDRLLTAAGRLANAAEIANAR